MDHSLRTGEWQTSVLSTRRVINQLLSTTNLQMIFDGTLNHVAEITKKANKILGLLRRNLAYIGFVRPLLEYASSAWDPHTDQLVNEIEKVQRRAARFVLSDYHNYEPGSITKMLEKLGWKTLQQRRKTDRLNLFNKALNNLAALQFMELIKEPSRYTRHMHSKHFITISTRTNVYKFSFLPRTIVN